MNRFPTILLVAGLAAGAACQPAAVAPGPRLVLPAGAAWQWVSTVGGLTGRQTDTPASTGTMVTWRFRADSTVLVAVTRQGAALPPDTLRYALGTVRSIYSGQPARSLTLHRRSYQAVYVLELSATQLALADNHPDGFTQTFAR